MVTWQWSQEEEVGAAARALRQLALPLLLLDLLPMLEGVHLIVVLPHTNSTLGSGLSMSCCHCRLCDRFTSLVRRCVSRLMRKGDCHCSQLLFQDNCSFRPAHHNFSLTAVWTDWPLRLKGEGHPPQPCQEEEPRSLRRHGREAAQGQEPQQRSQGGAEESRRPHALGCPGRACAAWAILWAGLGLQGRPAACCPPWDLSSNPRDQPREGLSIP